MTIENLELKQIKKDYGEEFMHLCRTLFPTILEHPGLLLNILENNIAPTRSLIIDIKEHHLEEQFKNYIYSFINIDQKTISIKKNPFELLKEKGYILYHCRTDGDIINFKKYYAPGEELCTFNGDENRIERCHVFFAVKDNATEIKRENFQNPDRQDEYGTSVISIQFTRGSINTLSIKNRYNHIVNNPDATFSNNLDNIIPGLTSSFEQYYDLNITQERKTPTSFFSKKLQYIIANDGKYYKYNHELRENYYCENNIIINHGNVIDKYAKEKERYIVMDYYILDKKDKKIFLYDNYASDSFLDSINELGIIKNIVSTKDKTIIIEYNDGKKIYIGLNNRGNIISYRNDYVKEIKNGFLSQNKSLTNIELPNVESIENSFLCFNNTLKSLLLPRVKIIKNTFLTYNNTLTIIELPEVKIIGNSFLAFNNCLNSILIPKIEEIGQSFLCQNQKLADIYLPKKEESLSIR